MVAGGALLACATVALDRLQMHTFGASTVVRVIGIAGVATLTATGASASRRLLAGVRQVSERHELRAAGLAFAYAGLLLTGAGYAPNFAISFVVQLLGATLIGVGVGPVLRVLAARTGAARTAGAALVVGAGGAVGAVVGPVLANAVAVYGQLRVWDLSRPATLPGMRATLLVAAIVGVAGAGIGNAIGVVLVLFAIIWIVAMVRAQGARDPLRNLGPGMYQPAKSQGGEVLPLPPPQKK